MLCLAHFYACALSRSYSVVLHRRKLPMGLLSEPAKAKRMNLLSTESFEDTFGPKRRRKRPNLGAAGNDLSALVAQADQSASSYKEAHDTQIVVGGGGATSAQTEGVGDADGVRAEAAQKLFEKGQSRRIWGELYKVLDCSDVVVQVLDARDPLGTRSRRVEHHLRKNAKHKHLILVLNKCDLVPTWVTKKWVTLLSSEYPTLAYHASMANSFGKGSLITLLRQYAQLHKDKKQISVGFIGYPNVGKSSVINSLMKKKVCNVAPIPGETKVWQYITLMKRIYLIDCPGVVYNVGDSEADTVLKGVVRAEKLLAPEEYIPALLRRVKPEYVARTYGIPTWKDAVDFMEKVGHKTGKLKKGGEPNTHVVAIMLLNDFQRGRLPYFVPPPDELPSRDAPLKKKSAQPASAAGSGGDDGTAAAADGATKYSVTNGEGDAGAGAGAGTGAGAGSNDVSDMPALEDVSAEATGGDSRKSRRKKSMDDLVAELPAQEFDSIPLTHAFNGDSNARTPASKRPRDEAGNDGEATDDAEATAAASGVAVPVSAAAGVARDNTGASKHKKRKKRRRRGAQNSAVVAEASTTTTTYSSGTAAKRRKRKKRRLQKGRGQ